MITDVEPLTEVTLKLTLAELDALRLASTLQYADAAATVYQFRRAETAAGREILAEGRRKSALFLSLSEKLHALGQQEFPL